MSLDLLCACTSASWETGKPYQCTLGFMVVQLCQICQTVQLNLPLYTVHCTLYSLFTRKVFCSVPCTGSRYNVLCTSDRICFYHQSQKCKHVTRLRNVAAVCVNECVLVCECALISVCVCVCVCVLCARFP